MTREDIRDDILNIKSKNILCQIGTGIGKSKIALDYAMSNKAKNILIVYPFRNLKDGWIKEILKWKYTKYMKCFKFTTYASLHKYAGKYDIVIYDECHHLSEKKCEAVKYIVADHNLLLSATVNKDVLYRIKGVFKDISLYTITEKEAIENGILANPKVILIPLELDNTIANVVYTKKGRKPATIQCEYNTRWRAFNQYRDYTIQIKCTPRQYYNELTSLYEWHKRKGNTQLKMRKALERLEWLAIHKTKYVKDILEKLSEYRTLTFCANIEHTELLGTHCINSKNKNASKYLEMFNNGEIDHITAAQMLNEGCNLNDCQVGIFANINASDTIIVQKTGRILRHKNPIIIIPYFRNTREEEIVKEMCNSYKEELITISTIENMKL